MADYVLISSSIPVKNNYGTIVFGGNVAATKFNSKKPVDLNVDFKSQSSITPGSGAVTGLRPATTATGATFNKMPKQHYLGPYLGSGMLAGVASTVQNTPASDYGRRSIHRLVTARRINITSWDYKTGVATYGGSRGGSYTYNAPQGGSPDDASNPIVGVPGEFAYRYGGAGASGVVLADYATRYEVK